MNISRNDLLTVAGAVATGPDSLKINDQEATVYHDLTFAVTNGIAIIDGMNTFLAKVTDAGVTRSNRLQMFLPQYVNLSYDLNGNLLSDGQHGYEYDCANQLTRITVTNGWKSEFGYDGFGRRRVRKEYAWMPGAVNWQLTNEVHYVYRGMTVLQERAGNNTPLVTYTRGLDLSGTKENAGGIGGLLARTDGSGSAFYHSDGNGNVTALINSSGVVQAHYLYDPYGNLLAKSGPLAEANVYRFSSKEYDRNAGLYYYGFRYYEPNFQRWLNRDPLGEAGGLDLYAFVSNDPVNILDPLGLWERILLHDSLPDIVAEIIYSGTVEMDYEVIPTLDGSGVIVPTGPHYDPPSAPDFPMFYPGIDFTPGIYQPTEPSSASIFSLGAGLMFPEMLAKGCPKSVPTVPVSRWGRPGLQPGDWVMKGNATRWNFIWSGKYQPLWMPGHNIPAPFLSGETFLVPSYSLEFPPGLLGPLKGFIGQRIYNP